MAAESSSEHPFRAASWLYVETDALNPTGERVQASLTLDVVRDEFGSVRKATILLEGQVLDNGALAEHLGGLSLDRLDVVEHLSDDDSHARSLVIATKRPKAGEQLSFGDLLAEESNLALAIGYVSADVPLQQRVDVVEPLQPALEFAPDEAQAPAC